MSRAASLRCRRLSLDPPGGTVVDSLKGGQGVGNKPSTPRAQSYVVIPGGGRPPPGYRYARDDEEGYVVIPGGGRPHPGYRYARDDRGHRDHRDRHRDDRGHRDDRDHPRHRDDRDHPRHRDDRDHGSLVISDNGGEWARQKAEWRAKRANAREDHPGGRSLTKGRLWLHDALVAQERERRRAKALEEARDKDRRRAEAKALAKALAEAEARKREWRQREARREEEALRAEDRARRLAEVLAERQKHAARRKGHSRDDGVVLVYY
jgi:hypothetical protein